MLTSLVSMKQGEKNAKNIGKRLIFMEKMFISSVQLEGKM